MTRRLLLGYVGLTLFVLVVLEVPLGIQNGRTERRNLEAKIEHDATNLASISQTAVETRAKNQIRAVAAIAYRYGRDTGARVVVLGPTGIALVDTQPAGGARELFASRPEIAAALAGQVAVGARRSATLHESLLYVAVPVAASGVVEGAVRITYPTSAVDARITRYWLILIANGAVVLLLAVVAGTRLAAFVTRPVRALERAAAAVGDGDLETRAPESDGPPEVRSLARVFNQTVSRLEQLVRSQDEFVADASHQLRTPLTALRLRLENLESDVSERGSEDLEGSLEEVERLARLVEGLLTLARVDGSPAAGVVVDLGELVADRIAAWSARAEDLDVRLVGESNEGGTVLASKESLREVLDNVIDNALQAAPAGSEVTVTAGRDELRVRDEGPGLSPVERERAFDRFWRARPGAGSGLGLSIVKRLVEAEGGRVELAAASRQGLEVVVRLRAATGAAGSGT